MNEKDIKLLGEVLHDIVNLQKEIILEIALIEAQLRKLNVERKTGLWIDNPHFKEQVKEALREQHE